MLLLLVRTVEHATSAKHDVGKSDGVVQLEEAAKFLQRRSGGATLEDATHHSALTLGGVQFGEALESSKAKIIITAAAIRIQMASRARKARQRVAERKQRLEEHKQRAVEYASAET